MPTPLPAISTTTPPRTPKTGLQTVIDDLVQALGDNVVVQGARLDGRNSADWSGVPSSRPAALLQPRSTREVATAVRTCNRYGWPLAIQGGLTGLAGGANVQPGEIALSLCRLNTIESIDTLGGTAVVQAGVTLECLQEAAAGHGWSFPLDLGARGSCHLGGNAATNAGGNRVLRYGMMRNLVRGMEVVLPDGTILDLMDAVIKNNAGFDLKQLFIGSEGTLGIITRLSLSLVPLPTGQRTVLCAVPDFRSAACLLTDAKRLLPELSALEVMWDDYFEASAAALGKRMPFASPSPLYVLIETQGEENQASTDAIERLLEQCLGQETVTDAIIAQSGAQAAELWEYREGISELLAHLKPCAAFDVSVALPQMDALVGQLRQMLTARFPSQRHLFFGHLGDGNLHLVSGPFNAPDDLEAAEQLVYRTVGEFGGSISAEHGVGVVKRHFLHHSRSEEEVSLMRSLKQMIDPGQILNRNRVFAAAGDTETFA